VSTLPDPHRRWDTHQQAIDHFIETKPRGRNVNVDFSRVSMFDQDRKGATPVNLNLTQFSPLNMVGAIMGQQQGLAAHLPSILMALSIVSNADANRDGTISPDEISAAVAQAFRSIPECQHLADDPQKVARIADLAAQLYREVTAA